jgi:hypothetical protein
MSVQLCFHLNRIHDSVGKREEQLTKVT